MQTTLRAMRSQTRLVRASGAKENRSPESQQVCNEQEIGSSRSGYELRTEFLKDGNSKKNDLNLTEKNTYFYSIHIMDGFITLRHSPQGNVKINICGIRRDDRSCLGKVV